MMSKKEARLWTLMIIILLLAGLTANFKISFFSKYAVLAGIERFLLYQDIVLKLCIEILIVSVAMLIRITHHAGTRGISADGREPSGRCFWKSVFKYTIKPPDDDVKMNLAAFFFIMSIFSLAGIGYTFWVNLTAQNLGALRTYDNVTRTSMILLLVNTAFWSPRKFCEPAGTDKRVDVGRESEKSANHAKRKKIQTGISVIYTLLCVLLLASDRPIMRDASNPLADKQWYLNNDGDKDRISDSDDAFPYLPMEAGIDIGYREMSEMLDGFDLNKEIIVAVIDSGVDFGTKICRAYSGYLEPI